jgi:hypothetical protein
VQQTGRSRVIFPILALKCFIDINLLTALRPCVRQPVTEISSSNISFGGKSGQCLGLTTLPLSCVGCLKIWEPQHPGTFRTCNRAQ